MRDGIGPGASLVGPPERVAGDPVQYETRPGARLVGPPERVAWHSLQGNETRVNLVGPPERVAGQSVQAATGSLLSGGLKGTSRIRSYLIHPQLLELPRGTIAQWAHGYVAGCRRGSDRARQGGCYEVGAMCPDPVAAARGFWTVLGRAGFDPPFSLAYCPWYPFGGWLGDVLELDQVTSQAGAGGASPQIPYLR